MTKSTLQLLENNRQTHKALQNNQTLPLPSTVNSSKKNKKKNKKKIKQQQQDNEQMEEEDMNNTNNNTTSMQIDGKDEDNEKSIKEVLEEILGKEPWANQRASKMDLDDFLQLLSEFNTAGIHFC